VSALPLDDFCRLNNPVEAAAAAFAGVFLFPQLPWLPRWTSTLKQKHDFISFEFRIIVQHRRNRNLQCCQVYTKVKTLTQMRWATKREEFKFNKGLRDSKTWRH